MRIAVCPGSFDPVTLGHVDLVRRAARQFDRVYFCAMHNERKSAGLLTGEERRELLALAAADLPNVTADCWDGYLVDYARRVGATAVVKGVRGAEDLRWEMEMAEINRRLYPELETFLLPAKAEYGALSSSLVRSCLREGKDIRSYVPAPVADILEHRKGR